MERVCAGSAQAALTQQEFQSQNPCVRTAKRRRAKKQPTFLDNSAMLYGVIPQSRPPKSQPKSLEMKQNPPKAHAAKSVLRASKKHQKPKISPRVL